MMPNPLQMKLSPRPPRSTVPLTDITVGAGGAIHTQWFSTVDDAGQPISYMEETHFIRFRSVKSGTSGPPLHVHLRQDETFLVLSGKLGVVVNEKEQILAPESGPMTIPCGARHRFFSHPSATEDLKIRITLSRQDLDNKLDETFMRNFFGYVADCEKHNMEPSPFQLLYFLYESDMVLTPPFYVPIPILKALHYGLVYGVAGRLLGYRATYPEYSGERTKAD